MSTTSPNGLSIGSIVRRAAHQYGNRTAFIFGDERCSFAEYNRRVNRAAHTLRGLGREKGGHVAILGKNSIQYLELCHGAGKAGIVFGTINWRLTVDEIAFIVSDADNEVLFVEAEFQPIAAQLKEKLPNLRYVVYGGPVKL